MECNYCEVGSTTGLVGERIKDGEACLDNALKEAIVNPWGHVK